ncbi:MAG: methyltransferase domain-containing protein [Candidatus Dactylopiibacterium sp.]|nr:methyltransferase domain-containing protein [Candidatus Dactylopiibacterium sp.]
MTRSHHLVAATLCAVFLSGTACAQTDTRAASEPYTPSVGQAGKDVVWVPTSQALVDRMLEMAELAPTDRLVDLGSGDGRTVITAAKRGASARGIEFNPDLVALSRRAAQAEGVGDKALFEHGDIFKSDFSNATVITLFLLPDLNLRLRPILLDMRPGTRVVSNSFDMGDWRPDETAHVTEGCSSYCNAYKWIVPARVHGRWSLDGKPLVLNQKYQNLDGSLREGATPQPISDARLDGAQIRFSVGQQHYTGRVEGNVMQGTVNGKQAWRATRTPG